MIVMTEIPNIPSSQDIEESIGVLGHYKGGHRKGKYLLRLCDT